MRERQWWDMSPESPEKKLKIWLKRDPKEQDEFAITIENRPNYNPDWVATGPVSQHFQIEEGLVTMVENLDIVLPGHGKKKIL